MVLTSKYSMAASNACQNDKIDCFTYVLQIRSKVKAMFKTALCSFKHRTICVSFDFSRHFELNLACLILTPFLYLPSSPHFPVPSQKPHKIQPHAISMLAFLVFYYYIIFAPLSSFIASPKRVSAVAAKCVFVVPTWIHGGYFRSVVTWLRAIMGICCENIRSG